MTESEAFRAQMLIDVAAPYRLPPAQIAEAVKRPLAEEIGLICLAKHFTALGLEPKSRTETPAT